MTDAMLMNLHVHSHTMIIDIQYKIHDIPYIGYLVMAGKDVRINRLFAYCKGGNFNIHIWAWFGYFIC